MEECQESRDRCSLKDFIEIKVLGAGAMAVVKKVMQRTTGSVFALKVISRKHIEENAMEAHICREIRTHLQLSHPNIIRMYGFFERAEDWNLLMEYAPWGSLYGHLQKQPSGCLSEAECVRIFVDVVQGLGYLHKRGIAHRDLKTENVLMCEESVAKLADFGWCAESLTAGSKRQTFCGTSEYLSPELVSGEDHDHRVDMWAAGVLLYEILVGQPPFVESSLREAFRRICMVDIRFPPKVSLLAHDLIQQLLKRNPDDRPSIEDVLRHELMLMDFRSKDSETADCSAAAESQFEAQGSEPEVQRSESGVKIQEMQGPEEEECNPKHRFSNILHNQISARPCSLEPAVVCSPRGSATVSAPAIQHDTMLEIAHHVWHEQSQDKVEDELKRDRSAEYHTNNDWLSTRAPSSDSSSSPCSPCNKATESGQSSSNFDDMLLDGKMDKDARTNLSLPNTQEQCSSKANFGMVLEAPGWASSKITEGMHKVAHSIADTFSGFATDFESWKFEGSEEANLYTAGSEEANLYTAGSRASAAHCKTDRFLLQSSLVPAGSQHWGAFGFATESSSGSPFTARSLRPCSEFNSHGGKADWKGVRLLPDAEELMEQLNLKHGESSFQVKFSCSRE